MRFGEEENNGLIWERVVLFCSAVFKRYGLQYDCYRGMEIDKLRCSLVKQAVLHKKQSDL